MSEPLGRVIGLFSREKARMPRPEERALPKGRAHPKGRASRTGGDEWPSGLEANDVVGPPTDVVGPPTDVVGPPTDVVGPPHGPQLKWLFL